MDNYRALVAILLSVIIMVGYQYFFVPSPPATVEQQAQPPATEQQMTAKVEKMAPAVPVIPPKESEPEKDMAALTGKDVTVETDLYTAVFTENGGGVKSFKLKEYKESLASDSGDKELIATEAPRELPLYFSWGGEPGQFGVPVFAADQRAVQVLGAATEGRLSFTGRLASGLEMTRTMVFHNQDYRIDLMVEIRNPLEQPAQGIPYLSLFGKPSPSEGSNVFIGPAAYVNGSLNEVALADFEKGAKELAGLVSWVAYEGNYFMLGVVPQHKEGQVVRLSANADAKVSILCFGPSDVIPSGGQKQYAYTVYFGPKKLSDLAKVDSDLERIVNFGWFDVVAKPTLTLLNIFYRFTHNYGIAIILVTVLIKALFWPISQKGLESMRNMQKIQPKMAKLREKYKDDQERLNREVMTLYKTYKVNPLGGCLPMVMQIPVFFALYKVLLQSIELRHAPFFLWIKDLAAPDRLFIGFDIPYLGGLPVLTLLMGGSMFLQQKMSPSSGDPTQAKIMLMLPVVFTFMFVNFASGLVLYWFVNNLLAIGQQYLINRQATD